MKIYVGEAQDKGELRKMIALRRHLKQQLGISKLGIPRVSPPVSPELSSPVSKERNTLAFAGDEYGLSTLEWILIVAAVGGLATLGIFVVREAAGETKQTIQEGNEVDRLKADAEAAAVAGEATITTCARANSTWVKEWQGTFVFRWEGDATTGSCKASAVTA